MGWGLKNAWEADSWAPSSCLTHVASLALCSPAGGCAAGWGLPLPVWAPAHSPSSGEAAPEPRPAADTERAPPPGSQVNSMRGKEPTPGKKGSPAAWGSPAACSCKPCLGGAQCAFSTTENQLSLGARSSRVTGGRLLCPGQALPRLASLLGFLPRKEHAARGLETPLAPSWPQFLFCLAFAPKPQASLGRA